MSFWGAIAGAGISAAGSAYSNYKNIQNQNKIFGEQINLANTAHQREVLDLQLAGLNPILSAQGSGAETPSASTAQQSNPLASFATLGSLENQAKQAESSAVTADANMRQAQSNEWQIYDAKDLGYAGFTFVGFGNKGEVGRTQTIRINKVTGEVYDVLTGKRIEIVDSQPANSAGSVAGASKPLLNVDVVKSARDSSPVKQEVRKRVDKARNKPVPSMLRHIYK